MDNNVNYISVNETHLFQFPVIDFNGKAAGVPFTSDILKLPSFGDWWIWGVLATRCDSGASGQLASGSNIGINIFEAGMSKYWWTGGTLQNNALLPIQLVAGKAGNPALFSEAKFVKGGSNLAPYVANTDSATPTGSSLLYVALIATLADSAAGSVPVMPSLGAALAERKGSHYKAIVQFPSSGVLAGKTFQQTIPLNKETAFIMCSLTSDLQVNSDTIGDPRDVEDHYLVNCFDTRTTWKFVSPQATPAALLFGDAGSRPFTAPSFFYMQEDQNFAVEFDNRSASTVVPSFIFDGYLQENILAERVR